MSLGVAVKLLTVGGSGTSGTVGADFLQDPKKTINRHRIPRAVTFFIITPLFKVINASSI
jgi:hypothetical protein